MNDPAENADRLYTELEALADHAQRRGLTAAELPVLFAHAAGMTIGTNIAAGFIGRDDAERSIEALRDHIRSAAGLDANAKGRDH